MADITVDKLVVNTSLSAREIQTNDFKVKQQDGSLMSISEQLKKIPENWVKTVNGISADEEGNVEVQVGGSDSFIYTDPSTGDRFEVFGRKIPHPDDGSEQYPWSISTVQDLLNLKAAVEGTASEENPYRANHYYKQVQDIDMDGEEWTGIGLLKNAYNVDKAHTFTGSYDGNGHSITNLKLKVDESASDPTNRYLSLFRAVSGATIKNLTVDVAGFDGMASDDVTGAAIVGMVDGGATLENCTATGFLGTSETPVVHMTGGVICRVVTPEGGSAYDTPLTLTNVTNKVNVTCARKCGGIIANGVGKIIMTNVVNEGNITKTGTKSGDQVGGLIGYNDENVHVRFEFNGIKNTGTISSAGGPSYGQLMGCWQIETGTQTNIGDIAIANSNMPASTRCPTIGSGPESFISNAFPIYFGELSTDGLLHGVSALEDGKAYVYMVGNINESTGAVGTPPAYTLASGSITVDQKFGTPKIVDSNKKPITGTPISGTIHQYANNGGGQQFS